MRRHNILYIRCRHASIMRKIQRRKIVIKILNHIRRHRQGKQKRRRDTTCYVQDKYEVVAPIDFTINNINGLIRFILEIENVCNKDKIKLLKVNLNHVVSIDMYAISLMLSMLSKLSYKHIRYWGTYPTCLTCRQYIINSGFLDIVKSNIKGPEDKQKGTQIYMVGKDCVDSHRIGKYVRESMALLIGEPSVYPPVYDDICEISANSVEHANRHTIEKNWLVSISKEGDKLHFILTDTGLGILTTLRKKTSQEIRDLFHKSDSEVLQDVFLKVYQSVTGEINRHKGLPIIYESFTEGFISNLKVLTNKVLLDFETNSSKLLNKSFNGVLFSWTVSMDNYKKWINSL